MDPTDRATVRRIAGPLRIGTAAETKFLFGDDRFPWGSEFERAMARAGISPSDPVRVSDVRAWISDSVPSRGLRNEVADLVVIAWAALRQRGWYGPGGPEAMPKPGGVGPGLELRPEPLPTVDEWEAASRRARVLFTGEDNPHLTPASLAGLTARVREQAQGYANTAERLVTELKTAYERFALPEDAVDDRLATARATAELVAQLSRTTDRVAAVRTLVTAQLPGNDAAAVRSLLSAGAVANELRGFKWDRLGPLRAATGTDHAGASAAERVLDDLRITLMGNEFDHPLQRELALIDGQAFDWISRFGGRPSVVAPPLPTQPPPSADVPGGSARRAARGDDAALLRELAAFLKDHPEAAVQVEWRVIP